MRGVMVLAAAFLAGCGQGAAQATHRSAASGGIVPWVDRPAPAYTPPPPLRPPPYPTSAPACRAGDLRAQRGRGGVGAGNWLYVIVFRNLGPTTCLLRGYPTLTGVGPNGRRVTLRTRRSDTYFGRLAPADMRPGGRTLLYVATGAGCTNLNPIVYRHLVIDVPGVGVIAGGNAVVTKACGFLAMTQLGRPPRPARDRRPKPGTFGALHARLALPPRVRAGTALDYVITLANPSDRAVPLDPCPTYTEWLVPGRHVVRRAYELNCDTMRVIPPHGRVRYAMRVRVPADAAFGMAKVSWSGNTPTGPWAGSAVEVIPRSG